MASGVLPPGLKLFQGVCAAIVGPCQAPAEISGTPTTTPKMARNYTFTILVSDGTSKAFKKFTITITSQVRYFRYVMRGNANEWFIVKMTNPATIQQALDDLNGTRSLIVSGIVNSGNKEFNSPWSWHLDPATIVLGPLFIELCNARPSYVEAHLAEWLGRQYCPWNARVNAVYDTPPIPIILPKLTPATPAISTVTYQINVAVLNIRRGGALSAKKIGSVRNGDILKKLEEKRDWIKVKTSNGQIGWVFGQYVK